MPHSKVDNYFFLRRFCSAFLTVLLLTICVRLPAQSKAPDTITPLMHAAFEGELEQAKKLLQAGPAVDVLDKYGCTALMWTAIWPTYDFTIGGKEERHIEIARLLLAAGADINACSKEGNTALVYAAAGGHNLLAMVLIEQGADVTLRDKHGRSALTYAAGTRDKTLVATLLAKGLHKNGIEALLLGDLPLARSLLVQKQNMLDLGPHGETALMLSASRGESKLVRALLVQSAVVNTQDEHGFTALMMTVGAIPLYYRFLWHEQGRALQQESETVMTQLLWHGASIDAQDKNGNTALMIAAANQSPTMVRFLLKHHPRLNSKNHLGQTALAMASEPIGPASTFDTPQEYAEMIRRRKLVLRMLKRAGATE